MKKKLFATIVAAALAVSMVPVAFASESDGADSGFSAVDSVDQQVCSECGEEGSHTETCSQYALQSLDDDAGATVYEQLTSSETLLGFRAALLAEENYFDVLGLTAGEISVLKARVKDLYSAIEAPTEDDDYYFEELLETLTYLPANECAECGEFDGHASDCVRNVDMLPADGSISGQTISGNVTWNLTRDCSLNGKITVNEGKTLTINGNGFTIAKNFTGNNAMFEVYGTLIVNGTIIDGASKSSTRAAIWVRSGNLTLNGTTIKDYTRTSNYNYGSGRGGAIQLGDETTKTANATITNSIIDNCDAPNGSAILLSQTCSGTVLISNSTIRNCSSTGSDWGGTIRTQGQYNGRLTIESCIIEGNYSSKNGGGVYWNACGPNAQLTIRGTEGSPTIIRNNSAGAQGGGVHLGGQNIVIEHTHIIGNSAPNGGGISLTPYDDNSSVSAGCSVTLGAGAKVEGNSATGFGGGVYMGIHAADPATGQTFSVTVNEGASIRGNTAANGGAFAVIQEDGDKQYHAAVNVIGGVICGNAASNNGGAFYISRNYTAAHAGYSLAVAIRGGQILGNTAGGNGGAIYLSDTASSAQVTVSGGTVGGSDAASANSAVDGGALYVSGGSFAMTGGSFEGNSASGNGGAVFVTRGSVTMGGGSMSSNLATSGGAVYVSGGSFEFEDGTLSENQATANGGAVYVSGGDFEMSGGEATDNSAAKGGAVYVSGGDFEMTNGEMEGNSATNGGAVYMEGGDIAIRHGVLNSNSATTGGAVYMSGASAVFTMESGEMRGNEASHDGGAVYAAGGEIYIGLQGCNGDGNDLHEAKGTGRHHPQIEDNEAANAGGGIAVDGQGSVHLYCGDVVNNDALYKGVGYNVFMNGGKVYLHEGADVGTIVNSELDPDLVIVGGELVEGSEAESGFVTLKYYQSNDAASTSKEGKTEEGMRMNLPDGVYFFDAPQDGYMFFGWTPKGAASAEKFVRDDEEYLPSGAPVTVIDTEVAGEAQGTYDGTEDKTMNLYALWAPSKSRITYAGYVVEGDGFAAFGAAQQAVNPAEYSFSYASNVVGIADPGFAGYELDGWYIYQNEGQNANWGSEYEPAYLGGEKSYANLDFSKMKYVEVSDAEGNLNLEMGESRFGDITLIANYVPAYAELTISKVFPQGASYSVDADQAFVFRISGEPRDRALPAIDMDVVVYAGGSVTVTLPVGSYTVVEDSSWSWRYSCDDAEREVVLDDPGEGELLSFVNTQATAKWLNFFGIEPNVFVA